ncbi:hypothetical protein AB835_10130 [Candidatus Endobugula sertula]|uniref:MSHA biogenesis protein MshO n=1 Tax=Candidatus Endobugula sertula TaxID=62101 RepID=A0A1D2QNQ5_9GAMM|nr:hypothetical protein AB835_10130 [Candidatus Endobugula sertula]
MMLCTHKNRGFTLIELIAVMVILGIIASFSASFVVDITRSFLSVSRKNDLLSESRLATEYMMRRLRNALPYSVRMTNSGQCLEFMSIVSSGLYRDIVPSVVNGAFANGNTTPIVTAPFIINNGSPAYMVIGANAATELYGVTPGSLAEIDSINATSVTLTANKQWLRNSINQRFYIVDTPNAFCLLNNELRLYRHLSMVDDDINTSSSYDLLAQSVSELAPLFSISSAVEDRNIRITLSLLFTQSDNRLEVIKQVVVRNVP